MPLYQGSRPSLADYAPLGLVATYQLTSSPADCAPLGLDGSLSLNILAGRCAPLGLDTFEPVACDRIDPLVRTVADPIPAAPTGRNLIAKGVNPGKGQPPFTGPEGDESTADVERIDVVGFNPIRIAYPTTIHVRGGVHSKRNLSMSAFLVRYVGLNSRRCVPFRAEKRMVPLYQGSRPSLADYAPLGLGATYHLSSSLADYAPLGLVATYHLTSSLADYAPLGLVATYHLTSSLTDCAPLGLDTFEPVACDRIDPTENGRRSDSGSPNGA